MFESFVWRMNNSSLHRPRQPILRNLFLGVTLKILVNCLDHCESCPLLAEINVRNTSSDPCVSFEYLLEG